MSLTVLPSDVATATGLPYDGGSAEFAAVAAQAPFVRAAMLIATGVLGQAGMATVAGYEGSGDADEAQMHTDLITALALLAAAEVAPSSSLRPMGGGAGFIQSTGYAESKEGLLSPAQVQVTADAWTDRAMRLLRSLADTLGVTVKRPTRFTTGSIGARASYA